MWTLKLDENEQPVLKNGTPLYLDKDGQEKDGAPMEMAFDPNQLSSKVLELRSENKRRRETNEKNKQKLAILDGIDDLEAWKAEATTAIETVGNYKDKDLAEAAKVEKLKKEMKLTYEEQSGNLKKQFHEREVGLNTTISEKDKFIRSLMVSSRFATSPLFSGVEPKTILPPEIAETYFGDHFRVETTNGIPILKAYDNRGEEIPSRKNMGEAADFDEAMEFLFEQYPGKDKLIRSISGSGSTGGISGANAGTPIAKLEIQLAEARKSGDVGKSLMLKNRIFDLKKESSTRR